MAIQSSNPLQQLHRYGQSFWLDQISRSLIVGGQLARLREQDGLRGVTSNPSIFKKAIVGSSDYDELLGQLARQGATAEAILEALAIRDIQEACDVLRPVYDASDGEDGFVSLELSPLLAHDTERSLAGVRRLWPRVNRPNLLLKVPATPEGIPVIEQALSEGYSINVTLIFSLDVYEQVAEAYLRALERRAREGKELSRIASVASFFVSRIDVLVDEMLERRLPSDAERVKRLRGRAAVACSKLAYQRFKLLFGSGRFKALRGKGARVQRPLWASTSTKNPSYSDVMYIEPLVGPHTVNTMPLETAMAFRDHGAVASHLEEGLDEAVAVLNELAALGVSLDQVTEQLLREGVQKFVDPCQELLEAIERKRQSPLS